MDVLHYYPLTPGSTHTYQFSFLGRMEGLLQIEVLDSQERPNGTFARVQRHLTGAEPEKYAVVIKEGELRVDGLPLLKATAMPGDRWEQVGEGGLLEYELVRQDRQVEVPAGSFADCVEIKVRREGAVVFHTLLAPGVGMVWHRAMIPGGYSELALLRRDVAQPPCR